MATSEDLNIIIGANVRELNKSINAAQRRIERFSKQSQRNLSQTSRSFDVIGTAARRLGPALAAAFSINAIQGMANAAIELGVMADKAQIGVEEFQRLAFATRQVGINNDQLADILKDVSDRIGDFAVTGGGPLLDFMEQVAPKVGLTIEQLQRMSSSQALQTIISALEQTGATAQETTFYLEALASDASLLAPVFADGGKAARDAATELDAMGGVLDEDMIERLREAREQIDLLSTSITNRLLLAFGSLAKAVNSNGNRFRESMQDAVDYGGELAGLRQQIKDLEAELEVETDPSRIQIYTNNLAQARERLANALARTGNIPEPTLTQPELEDVSPSPLSGPFDFSSQPVPAPDAPMPEARPTDMLVDQQAQIANALLQQAEAIQRAQDPLYAYNADMEMLNETLDNTSDAYKILAADIKQTFEKAQNELDPFYQATEQLGKTIESSFSQAFASVAVGASSAKDAFKQFAAAVIQDMIRIIATQNAVGGASIGGALLRGAAGLFSGFSGGDINSRLAVQAGSQGIASGGAVSANTPYTVGEHGRELFVPSTSGRIMSAPQTERIMTGGGDGIVINQTIQITTGVQQTVRAEVMNMMPAIAEASKQAVADARMRGGRLSGALGGG